MENGYLIAGLGNPGRQYEQTRHNAGFLVVEELAKRWKANWSVEKKFKSHLARAVRQEKQSILCKPTTFMNASGDAIGKLVSFAKIPTANVLIVVDDADLPLGTIRLRPSGSTGGHHGLESIENCLGTSAYARQRIGIGREEPAARQITDYVLSRFRSAEQERLEKVLQTACEQIECWLEDGIEQARNRFNGVIKT